MHFAFLSIMLVLLAAAPLTAFAQVSQITNAGDPDRGCGADYLGQTWTCNAGEISISQVISLDIENNPTECVLGEPLLITTAVVEYAMNTTDVRNLTMYWGDQEDTDPRGFAGAGESCTAFSLPGPFNPNPDGTNPFGDIDGDQCGDLAFSVTNAVRTFTNVPFNCQDNNDDGTADLQVLLTWDNKKNTQNCGIGEGLFFPTDGGTRSKCDFQIQDLPVDIVYPPILTLVKEVVGDNGGTNLPTEWTLNASGPTPISGVTGSPAVTAVKVDAGDYTLGESGPDGYNGTWACDNATVVNGNEVTLINANPAVEVTCTLTNDDIAPTLTLVKEVTGGDALPGDFVLHVEGGTGACEQVVTDVWYNGDSVTPVCSNTQYAISEELEDGYALTSITCQYQNPADSSEGPLVTMSPGQSVTCTLANEALPSGTLTVVKVVEESWNGPLGPGDFSLSITESGGEGCGANSDPDASTGDSIDIVQGCTYSVGEIEPPGYDPVGDPVCLDTANNNEDLGHPFTAAGGEAVVCTITNVDLPAQLTLVKEFDINHNGDAIPDEWTLSASGFTPVSGTANSPEVTDVSVGAGSYTLGETGPDGYTASDWVCQDPTGAIVPVDEFDAVVLENEDIVTCTITNADIAPTLTLLKTVFNNDGGTLEPDDPLFQLVLAGDDGVHTDPGLPYSHEDTPTIVSNVEYTVSETPPDGYELEDIQCVRVVADGPDEDLEPTFTPNEGDVITCTIINNDIAPTLTLVKDVTNDDGGTITDPAAFDITVRDSVDGDATYNHGDTIDIVGGRTYTVFEDPPENYTVTDVTCIDLDEPPPDGAQPPPPEPNDGFVAVLGHAYECTVYNDDDPPTLLIQKVINNDDGGTVEDPTAFPITLNGGDYTDATVYHGDMPDIRGEVEYTVSEVPLENYEVESIECTVPDLPDFQSEGGTFTAVSGETVTCTVTNNDIPPTLLIQKVIINDSGGTITDPGAFPITLNGGDYTNATVYHGDMPDIRGEVQYTISETPLPGYEVESIECTVPDLPEFQSSGGTFTAVSGETVTCTVTNNDLPIARFAVIKEFSDANEMGVDVKIVCTTGLPLEQEFEIFHGQTPGVMFVVDSYLQGTMNCEIFEVEVPEGYESDYTASSNPSGQAESVYDDSEGCYFDGIYGGIFTCVIRNDALPGTFTVWKDWVIPNDGGDYVVEKAHVTITCDSPILEDDSVQNAPDHPLDNVSYQLSGHLGDDESLVARVETLQGPATCSATEQVLQSGVEMQDDCGPREIPAGGSSECTFTNTVFFEGIPTLSQYGLAIMALLMLGMGAVAFRRIA